MKRTNHPEKEKVTFGLPDIGIPSEILFHPNLTNTEKILFGFLRNLAQGKNGCWASNHYLGNLLGVSNQTISDAIANLKRNKFIKIYTEQKEFKTNRKIFINPEFPMIYHDLMMEIQEQLKKGTIVKKTYPHSEKDLPPTSKRPTKYVNEYVNNKNDKKSTPSKKKTWKQLSKQYGRSPVKFVKYFLEKQKKNFPKLIKDDITPNSERVLSSLDCIDKLQRLDKFDFETDIKPTLETALSDQFWAKNILSLGSLRNKGQNGEKKFVNIQTTLSSSQNLPINHSDTPDEIITKQKWSEDRLKLLKEQVFTPVLTKLNGSSSKTEVTLTICELITWIETRQQRPPKPKTEEEYQIKKSIYSKWDLIPSANKLVVEFIRWLDEQSWISVLKPGHFDVEGKTFSTFLNEYQREIGFDVLEGRRLT